MDFQAAVDVYCKFWVNNSLTFSDSSGLTYDVFLLEMIYDNKQYHVLLNME